MEDLILGCFERIFVKVFKNGGPQVLFGDRWSINDDIGRNR